MDMKELFINKLNYRIRDCFIRFSRTAPAPLLGTYEIGLNEPLYLDSVLRIDIDGGKTDGDSVTLGSIESRFPNTVNELSINYPVVGGAVVKDRFTPLERYVCQQALDDDDRYRFQMARDDAYATFIKESTVDPALRHIHAMIGKLSARRFRDATAWNEILLSLAATRSSSRRFYCVAVMVALDHASNVTTWGQFQKDWHAAVSSRPADRAKYSPASIRYWAEHDAPSQMRRYQGETVRSMLVGDVRHLLVWGRIHHSHIAAYLYFRFPNAYITYNVTKTIAHWYEFPDGIFDFISEEFKDIVVKVHSDLRSLTTGSPCGSRRSSDSTRSPPGSPQQHRQPSPDEDAKLRHAKALFKAFESSIVSIFNNKFKRSVVDEATGLFKRHHFVKQLDRTEHILGVGNGVVEFNGPDAALLTGYHTYPISLYMDTNYIPYDEDNQFVQTVYRMLRSFVPDDEMAALDFLLYYFSTSLDWLSKESLFLIIHCGGCHVANAQIRMFDGSVELVQNVRVGDLLMGDDNKPRTVRKLHTGVDRMVRVAFNGEDYSFEMTEHHVLSLKFMDVHEVISQRGSGEDIHYAIWHRCCGSDEPARLEVPFASVKAARAYLASVLRSDKRAIKKGDVIDIQVALFMRWSKSWMPRVAPYRPGAVQFAAKPLARDPYELGQWLGVLVQRNATVAIAPDFKTSSLRHRFALLAGLLGACTAEARYELTLPYGVLLGDCIELIYSLGLGCIKVFAPRRDRETCACPRGRKCSQRSSPSCTRGRHGTSGSSHHYLTGDYYVHHNSNGKSVLMELFRRTLGEMCARKMPLSFITDQSRTRACSADPAVMELKGARMVYYSESDRNEKENFRVNCNHIVTSNHRFVIETTEHAVWRRFMSYRFKICFKHDCDPANPSERQKDPPLIGRIMGDKCYQEAFLSILVHYRSMLYAKNDGQIL
ncbi:hypothetical protein PC118_g10742 [Phytophthora cactorum]|uniref:Hom-end-associated Hint domain-containing protein n=1 Tax=Phytophthora cactorum TaxID=29920 RepID=A0A8T1FZ32_9STRA|nr:hypothetical protein PC118_g10742 [Phytophthora cactorum]